MFTTEILASKWASTEDDRFVMLEFNVLNKATLWSCDDPEKAVYPIVSPNVIWEDPDTILSPSERKSLTSYPSGPAIQ